MKDIMSIIVMNAKVAYFNIPLHDSEVHYQTIHTLICFLIRCKTWPVCTIPLHFFESYGTHTPNLGAQTYL